MNIWSEGIIQFQIWEFELKLTRRSWPSYFLKQTVQVAVANVPWASTSNSGGIPAT